MSKNFSKLFKSAITVIISVLIVFTVVQAGNITPPSGTPEAQFYTLTEIYEFITNNTAATEGGHDFTFSDGLTGTHRTLTEIYNALASLISADQVKLGATYLGVDGTLVPSSGTATTTDVCSTKTYFGDSQTDWNLATGALTIDAAKVLSGTTYCGTDGSMTNVEQQIITPSIINLTISQGYHDGTGYCAGDADLVVGNIKKDVGIFGATGTLYGDIDPTKVLTVASANGTYNASNLTEDNIKLGIAFGASGESGDYPSATYPLPGDTGAFDAAAGNILSGLESWTKAGSLLTGSMTNVGQQTITPSTTNLTITAGSHDGTGYCAGDAELVAGNIKKDVGIFGATGTLYGDIDPTKVLTVASAAGTYDASNLTASNVRYGKSFGVSLTGAMSSYPNTPSGISGLNSTVCSDAGWTWVADSNYDEVEDDPICVQPSRDSVGTKAWNTSVANDNTFIGNYSCSDSGDNLETFDAQLDGKVVENAGYGDDANVALAIADCKDGIRNLLSKAEVETFGYTAPNTSGATTGYNGPLTPKKLLEWKGTRLPTYNDFFGVCGNGTTSTTHGDYGVQIGRTDNVITANIGTWEWLSERHGSLGAPGCTGARVAGNVACSNFNDNVVTTAYGLRAVFRP